MNDTSNRVKAALIMGAIGNGVGYGNGDVEFNIDGDAELENEIYTSDYMLFRHVGSLSKTKMRDLKWSDEYVMLLANVKTVQYIAANPDAAFSAHVTKCVQNYVATLDVLRGRHPSPLLYKHLSNFKKGNKWNSLSYSRANAHANTLVRAAPFAFYFRGDRERMIRYTLYSARLTHNHLFSMYGAVIFNSMILMALKKVPLERWMGEVVAMLEEDAIDGAVSFESLNIPYKSYREDKEKLLSYFQRHRELRFKGEGRQATFDDTFHIPSQRTLFYIRHFDAPDAESVAADPVVALLFCYDALLFCGDSFEQLYYHACFHAGKTDITGAMCFLLFALLYPTAIDAVPTNLLQDIESLPALMALLPLLAK